MEAAFHKFHLFGKSHLAAIFFIFLIVYLLIRRMEKYPQDYPNRQFERRFGVLLLAWTVLQRVGLLAIHDFHIDYDLPFHLCSISTIAMGIYFIRPVEKYYDILFYWVFAGATLAIIFPDLKPDFPHFRYFSMFIGHGLLVFCVAYLLMIRQMVPQDNGWRAFVALNLVALFVAPLDYLTNGNYLFLSRIPEVDFRAVHLLPRWPYYLLVLDLFAYFYFKATYYVVGHLIGLPSEEQQQTPSHP